MGQITILEYTKNPITFIGKVAGICYNSNTENDKLNYKRGLKNIKDDHGRTFEFPDVVMVLDGYSARVIRELYTHIQGTSRLQASTRYIDYSDKFDYYTPPELKDNDLYDYTMSVIQENYEELLDRGYKKEDLGNLLPLGLNTKIVLKINMRAILHMAEVRMCSRAYIEFQELMKDMQSALSLLDNEWNEISQMMKPKCATCTEKENCEL
jgi:thymidylate synthase (FAD)